MDSIFAKTILLLASLFTVLTGADYVKISADTLTYDFKTGDQTPIYYFLNTENVGVKKVRFDVTSLSDWVSVSREGAQPSAKTTIELAQYSPLNFVLEIHPERLPDGVNTAVVTVEAIDLQTFSAVESKEVSIKVNKNVLKEAPSPAEVPAKTLSPDIEPILAPVRSPSQTLLPSPRPAPAKTKAVTPFLSPSPVLSEPASPAPILRQLQSLLESLRLFLKRLF